jgi:Trypsin-co-occurring domain 1
VPDAIEFMLDDGTSVVVAAVAADGSSTVGWGDQLKAAQKTLREALAPVTAAANQVVDSFQKSARRPDEIEVTIGVTLDAKLGAVLSSASAGAHLDVTLRWHAPEKESSPGEAGGNARSSPKT